MPRPDVIHAHCSDAVNQLLQLRRRAQDDDADGPWHTGSTVLLQSIYTCLRRRSVRRLVTLSNRSLHHLISLLLLLLLLLLIRLLAGSADGQRLHSRLMLIANMIGLISDTPLLLTQ